MRNIHSALEFLLVLVSISLILLGVVFIIAVGDDLTNGLIGATMLLAAFGLLALVRFQSRGSSPASTQSAWDKASSGFEWRGEKLKCKSCGKTLDQNDQREVAEGLMVICPRCDKIEIFDKKPVW